MKNQTPPEVLLKNLFDSPLAGDTEKRSIAAIYGYIKKLRRRIQNQTREITRLQRKLEKINETAATARKERPERSNE